jgi:molybdate transport system substrate-binding protein
MMEMELKNIFKIIVPLFAIVLLAGFTLGCQSTAATFTGSASVTAATSTAVTSTTSADKEISVFAGSASKPPLDEAAKAFTQKTGIKVYITYGGSGSVLSQMELAKTGDIYIPGSPDYMIKAENKKIVDPESQKVIAYLIPAIGVQHGNPENIQSLSDLARTGITVGIGNPRSVCVGLYAIEILEKNGLLKEVNANIVTQADSCEKTATLISLNSVDAILGWDVFHHWDSDNIDVIFLQADQLPRLAYIPAAISSFSKDRDSSEMFINYLISESGKDIFKKWGYKVTESEVRQFAPNAAIGGEYQLPEAYKELNK